MRLAGDPVNHRRYEHDGEPRCLTARPLTPDLWPALEDLFADSPVCGRCWCMYWRIGADYRRRPAAENRAAFREIVERGPPPGLIAFDEGVAVGWCQVTPRAAVPHVDRRWRLARVDDLPVWSLTCFYVRKTHRNRGVSAFLLSRAIDAARRAGAPALEAYPLDRRLSPSATSTGVKTTFERAGFRTVACREPQRPVMRHDLEEPG